MLRNLENMYIDTLPPSLADDRRAMRTRIRIRPTAPHRTSRCEAMSKKKKKKKGIPTPPPPTI